MQMPFKIKTESFKGWWHRLMYQWIKRYKLLFFFLFLVVLGVGGFQWYESLERYQWSEDEKKSYLDRTVKETAFQEEKFHQALSNLSELKADHEKSISVSRDFFLGKRKKAGER